MPFMWIDILERWYSWIMSYKWGCWNEKSHFNSIKWEESTYWGTLDKKEGLCWIEGEI